MTINHLNLTVTDPTETSAFLAKYFGLEPRGGNAGIQMLYDDRRMVLTLIKGRADDRDTSAAAAESRRGSSIPAASTSASSSKAAIASTRSISSCATTASRRTRRRTCTARGRSTSPRPEGSRLK